MKREVRAAFERRATREALEKRIREVLRTPPRERTPEQLALLSEHAEVVAPLMANLERSLRRKTQTEERLEEREVGGKRGLDMMTTRHSSCHHARLFFLFLGNYEVALFPSGNP